MTHETSVGSGPPQPRYSAARHLRDTFGLDSSDRAIDTAWESPEAVAGEGMWAEQHRFLPAEAALLAQRQRRFYLIGQLEAAGKALGPDLFGGIWCRHAAGEWHVAATSWSEATKERVRRSVTEPDCLRFVEVEFPLRDLESAFRHTTFARVEAVGGFDAYSMSLDVEANRVIIGTDVATAEQHEAIRAAFGPAVAVVTGKSPRRPRRSF